MAIEPVVRDLRLKLQSISGTTKTNFLSQFAKIHTAWHMAEMNTGTGVFNGSPIGFLSFHHEVVTVYVPKFASGLTPGPMANPSPPYRTTIDQNTDPVMFSHALEGWHNLVHRNKKYGANFGDPNKNIKMKIFWEFHQFIDTKFQNWLSQNGLNYDALDHTKV